MHAYHVTTCYEQFKNSMRIDMQRPFLENYSSRTVYSVYTQKNTPGSRTIPTAPKEKNGNISERYIAKFEKEQCALAESDLTRRSSLRHKLPATFQSLDTPHAVLGPSCQFLAPGSGPVVGSLPSNALQPAKKVTVGCRAGGKFATRASSRREVERRSRHKPPRL